LKAAASAPPRTRQSRSNSRTSSTKVFVTPVGFTLLSPAEQMAAAQKLMPDLSLEEVARKLKYTVKMQSWNRATTARQMVAIKRQERTADLVAAYEDRRLDGIKGVRSVPVEAMAMLLEQRQEMKSATAAAIFGLCFFAAWVVLTVAAAGSSNAYKSELPVRTFVADMQETVVDKAAWYAWVSGTLVPFFFSAETYNGEVLSGNSKHFGEFQEFYNLIGGIQTTETIYSHEYKCFKDFEYDKCFDHSFGAEFGAKQYLDVEMWRNYLDWWHLEPQVATQFMSLYTPLAACKQNSFEFIMSDPKMHTLMDAQGGLGTFMEDMFNEKVDYVDACYVYCNNMTSTSSSSAASSGGEHRLLSSVSTSTHCNCSTVPKATAHRRRLYEREAKEETKSHHSLGDRMRHIVRKRKLAASAHGSTPTHEFHHITPAEIDAAHDEVVASQQRINPNDFIQLIGQSVVNEMKCENHTKEPFLTRHTAFVEHDAALFNGETGRFVIMHMKITFETNGLPVFETSISSANAAHEPKWRTVCMWIFNVYIFCLFYQECCEMHKSGPAAYCGYEAA
jgi:hypothetical protein